MTAHLYRRRQHPEVAHHVVYDFRALWTSLSTHTHCDSGGTQDVEDFRVYRFRVNGEVFTTTNGSVVVVEGQRVESYELEQFRRLFELIPEDER